MDRPLHPAYAKAADNYNRISPATAEAFEDIRHNKFEKIQRIRKEADAFYKKLEPELPKVVRYKKQIPGPDDSIVNLTIFRPPGTEDEVLPILIHCHGGGYVLCSVHTFAKEAIEFCLGARAVLVFVEYSLSPEARYPVALEEMYSSLCWVRENADSIKGNPEKIAIFGDSAGGNMTAVVSLMAKDRGLGDVIKAQVMLYPTMFALSGYPSYELYGQGNYFLSTKDVKDYADAYISNEPNDLPEHYLRPLTSTPDQLRGLPPALLITAQCDVLRDEGEEYATKLLEAGVDVISMRMMGVTHGFMNIYPQETETPHHKRCLRITIDFIKEKLDY